MTIHILTLFPDFFTSALEASILKRAVTKNLVSFDVINLRNFTTDERRTADDRPFGGGPGMVMKVEPIDLALEALSQQYGRTSLHIVLTSAKGRTFDQPLARDYAQVDHLVIICGHYLGVDERVAEHLIDEEVRIGDYVLTGGEPAALVMADAVSRLIPGVLGNDESPNDESHGETGIGSFPSYTRPEEYQGWKVPEVLLSGNQRRIDEWRQKAKKKLTD